MFVAARPHRSLWLGVFLAPAVLMGCSGMRGGDADAGATADSGAFDYFDAGFGDAGIGPVLTVVSDPHSALAAIGVLQTQLSATSVHVTYQGPSGEGRSTPDDPVRDGNAVVPILGLQAETTYQLQAVVTLDDGGSATSPQVSLTTPPLPPTVPAFTVAPEGHPAPGLTLIARLNADPGAGDTDVTIVDASGRPVWYLDTGNGMLADFQKQPDHTYTANVGDLSNTVKGLPCEAGSVFRQYDVLGYPIHTWSAPPPAIATDCHELRIQPDGDALLFGVVSKTVNMSALADGGDPAATVMGDVLDRVRPDGGVAFSWSTFDHLQLDAIDPTVSRTGSIVDATHANAIDVMADGNYLISLRNMSQLVKIDATTGQVIWKLGGVFHDGRNAGDFAFVDDPLGGFSCQHGARELPSGDIILFDDGNGHSPPNSRAVEYALDTTARTATLVWSATANPALQASALGYAQRLDGGDTLITYGTTSTLQEVDPQGNVVWEVTDPAPGFGIYRAYRIDSLY